MIFFKNSFFGKLYILSNPDSNAETFLPKLHLIVILTYNPSGYCPLLQNDNS